MKNKDIKQKAREMFEEQMADLEHDRWARWQEYFFGKCEIQNPEDGYIYMKLPTDLYERWKRQIEQSYLELSEKEKESDRIEVRKYYPFIDQIIDFAIKEERGRIVEMIKKTQGSYVEDPFGNNKQGFFKEDIINLITNTNK